MGAVAGPAARSFLGISINPLVLVMACYLCRCAVVLIDLQRL